MNTHQLAGLFDALRMNLAPLLKADGLKAFEDVAEAFREQPDQPLKEFVKHVRKAFTLDAGNGRSAGGRQGATADVNSLIERMRAVRNGAAEAEAVAPQLEPLNNAQLRSILAAFGVPVSNTTARNLERVKGLLVAAAADQPGDPPVPPPPTPTATDLTLVEKGVRLFQELKAAPDITILEVRARMAPIRQYPKPVVEEISRRVGYTPDDTREKTFDRMLSNLEGIKMSQLRAKMILN